MSRSAARRLILAALALAWGGVARAEDPKPAEPPKPAEAKPADAKEPKPLDPKLRPELIKGMRLYLSAEEDLDPYKGREIVRSVAARAAKDGIDLLARMDLLRDLAYQGRGFLKDYRDKSWQKAEGNTEVHVGKPPSVTSVVAGDRLRLAFSLPKGYADDALAKSPRPDPVPTLVSLIEEKDYANKQWPGEEMITRRYGTNPAYKELFEKWIVFAPLAVRGNYLEDGRVRELFFNAQIKDFYQRYHVDFERLALDGDANTVLTIAATQPFFFCGVVVRKPMTGTATVDTDVVANYASVPVFVVGDETLQKQLKDAGHPDVTLGTDADVMTWLKARKRKAPKSFSWRVKTTQQVGAHWLFFEPNWNKENRTLKVEVLDTKEDPNTIKIEANGIINLSAFLTDEIVDLGREVRVVINGKEVSKQKYERSLEQVFEREPVAARLSMWYGMLASVVMPRTYVPDAPTAATGGAPPAPGAAPSPAPASTGGESEPAKWLKGAKQYEADGNAAAAETLYTRIVSQHPTSPEAAEAKTALARMKGGGTPPAPASPPDTPPPPK